MALRRHGLAQRRKAVGLTQESLAQRLGVERSTVVRWEAGDTEPLPSIRPTMARALGVSVDQLAELLTEPENAEIPGGTEVTIPVPLPEVRPEVRPGRAGFEDLIRPQVAETIEALRRVLRSAGVAAADLDAMLLVGGSSRVPPGSAELSRPVTVDADPQAAIGLGVALSGRPADNARPAGIGTASADVEPDDVQRRRARSRRFTRFAAAGVLVLVLAEGAASVPFTTSRSGPIPPIAAGTPAPVAAIPAPDIPAPGPGNSPPSNDSTGAVPLEPAAAPADGLATPGAAAVPAPHTTQATSKRRATSRSRPPAATAPQPPRTPAIPAEAYAWAHQAGLSASDHRRTRPRPAHRPRP